MNDPSVGKVNPRLSVVIPAYNEERYLGRTLDSLKDAAAQLRAATGKTTEFVVVDNASTDGTRAVAEAAGARVVTETERRIATVRNRGAKEAKGDIVVTCDADNTVSPNLLLRIDEVMAAGALGGGVWIKPEPGPWNVRAIYAVFDFFARLASMSFGVIYTDRATFHRLGGYPEDVYVGEDAFFVWALTREAARLKRPFVNLRDAYIVTSLRKWRDFGVLNQLGVYFKFVFFPWAMRRRTQCATWYDVRGSK